MAYYSNPQLSQLVADLDLPKTQAGTLQAMLDHKAKHGEGAYYMASYTYASNGCDKDWSVYLHKDAGDYMGSGSCKHDGILASALKALHAKGLIAYCKAKHLGASAGGSGAGYYALKTAALPQENEGA